MTEQSEKKRIDLKTTQVAAGSMASVTSAVAASQLGVAGTLVGAGVGSVVGAVAGAVYEHYLNRTHEHVRTVVPRRISVGGSATDEVTATQPMAVAASTEEIETPTAVESPAVETAAIDTAAEPDTAALPVAPPLASSPSSPASSLEPAVAQPGENQATTWGWLRSRRVALGLSAAAGLGIALVALTGFEAFTGQPVGAASDGGGTSIGRVFGGVTATEPTSTPSPDTATSEPTSAPTQSPPEPSPSPTATSPAPTSPPSTPSTSPTTEPVPEATQPG
jgi:hypothetical protein